MKTHTHNHTIAYTCEKKMSSKQEHSMLVETLSVLTLECLKNIILEYCEKCSTNCGSLFAVQKCSLSACDTLICIQCSRTCKAVGCFFKVFCDTCCTECSYCTRFTCSSHFHGRCTRCELKICLLCEEDTTLCQDCSFN